MSDGITDTSLPEDNRWMQHPLSEEGGERVEVSVKTAITAAWALGELESSYQLLRDVRAWLAGAGEGGLPLDVDDVIRDIDAVLAKAPDRETP